MRSNLLLIKHAMPVLDATKPAKEWKLSDKGKLQAKLLAKNLKPYQLFALYASQEPKAVETANIIAPEFDLNVKIVMGLEEIDRPVLPLVSQAEHIKMNKGIFETPEEPVIGRESAQQAIGRFCQAIQENVGKDLKYGNTAIVSHGTVISLFVEKHNNISAFDLWKTLPCAALVILNFPSYKLVGSVLKPG